VFSRSGQHADSQLHAQVSIRQCGHPQCDMMLALADAGRLNLPAVELTALTTTGTDCVAGATPAVSVVTVEVMVSGLAVPTVASTCTSLLSAGATSPGQVHVMTAPAITHAARTANRQIQKHGQLLQRTTLQCLQSTMAWQTAD
jgi:hypothetical protein